MEKVIDISVDIETFASSPDAALASIGAAASDGSTFYCCVNDPGGRYDPNTLRWHARGEAPKHSMGADQDALGLSDALTQFSRWLRERGANVEGKARIWSHATFDIPVLASAYTRDGWSRAPWHYRNCRDLRTLYDLAEGRPVLPMVGTAHNALDDAVYQLEEVRECFARIRENSR